jgi:hypothetical protein
MPRLRNIGAYPIVPFRESEIPCSTRTQFPFGLAARSHHALSLALSPAVIDTVATPWGAGARFLGTCRVAEQKTAATSKKPEAVPAVPALATIHLLDTVLT